MLLYKYSNNHEKDLIIHTFYKEVNHMIRTNIFMRIHGNIHDFQP